MISAEEARHSRKEIKLRAEEMAAAGGKTRGKNEIRSGARPLLLNYCIIVYCEEQSRTETFAT